MLARLPSRRRSRQICELLPAALETSRGKHFLKPNWGWTIARGTMKKRYTHKQGQYLAFIYYYTRIHGRAPAEAEMQRIFPRLSAFRASDDRDPRSPRA